MLMIFFRITRGWEVDQKKTPPPETAAHIINMSKKSTTKEISVYKDESTINMSKALTSSTPKSKSGSKPNNNEDTKKTFAQLKSEFDTTDDICLLNNASRKTNKKNTNN